MHFSHGTYLVYERDDFAFGASISPRDVKVTLGASSDTQSVVTGGDLKEGQLLILNPPAQFQGGPFGGPGGG